MIVPPSGSSSRKFPLGASVLAEQLPTQYLYQTSSSSAGASGPRVENIGVMVGFCLWGFFILPSEDDKCHLTTSDIFNTMCVVPLTMNMGPINKRFFATLHGLSATYFA